MLSRCTALAIILTAGTGWAQSATTLDGPRERVSYALGQDLGNQLRKLSIDVDAALFGQGLKDSLAGGDMLLTEQQVRDAISQLQADLKKREGERRKGTAETDLEASMLASYNKSEGERFLEANKKKEGIRTLPSGLQYKVLTAGGGKNPTEADIVMCHYRGTLIDGTEFDSSYKRNQPATFPVKGVIAGWGEALKLMNVGSKWQLFIPSALAYGEHGVGEIVGPNATLLFEVELLAIQ